MMPFAAALALLVLAASAQAADLVVSAAASLTNAFRELAPAFEARHPGTKVVFNFAASDALLAQIAQGAPVDVFASADVETMDRAAARGLIADDTRRDVALNTLVVVQPADASRALASLADLRRADVGRIVLGSPIAVPAGRYAKGALEAASLWTALAPKAVYAQNVRQALDYVARGEADAGFVYATDAAAQQGKVRVAFAVPTPTRITYPAAVVRATRHGEAARRFVELLGSPEARAILARHGFATP